MGTNRRFSRLWFVLPVPLWVVACSSEPAFNPGSSIGGRASNATSSASSSTTNTTNKNTTANSGGSKNSSGGATGNDTSQQNSSSGGVEDTGSDASSNGGSKSSTKRRTSSGGSENTLVNPSSGGNTVNWGEGGSRFVATNVAGAGPTCTNQEKDEGESDVDCGGICAPNTRCEVGSACFTARDCYSGSCVGEKCATPLVIIKNAGCVSQTTKCPVVAQDMRVRIQMMNVSGAPLDIKGMEIRYYFTNEAAVAPETPTDPVTPVDPEVPASPESSAVPAASAEVPPETPTAVAPGAEARVDDNSFSTIKGGAFTVSIVKMETATATADHYISIKITGGTIAADVNRVCDRSAAATDCAELEMNIHTVNYAKGSFDPSNDYSFVPASGYVNNLNITVHKGDDILWGTPPA
ncbi:MAG TPA: cellulose binding domain-containing protein [Polyangiaceae bacterium]|nr:cellulose binding domain-containing protein [Polyangiaceae bacterium]